MNISLQSQIIKDLTKQINQQLDDIFQEGLKRKGFIFYDQEDLQEFVRESCRCEDNPSKSEKVYYVNDRKYS